MAGGIFTATNPSYVNREKAYQLKGSESKFPIYAEDSAETGIAAASMISIEKCQIFIIDKNTLNADRYERLGVKNWKIFIASIDEVTQLAWKNTSSPQGTICCVNYYSGTTVVLKGSKLHTATETPTPNRAFCGIPTSKSATRNAN